jgi:dimethylglycine dehydrogenase
MAAGQEFDIRQVGGRALMSLRLEKNWGTWAREYRPVYGPFEAGLGRFVALSKNDFIGREGAATEKETGGERALTVFTVDGNDVDVIGDEPVYHNGKCVGWITSGGYAHAAGKSVAMGYMPRDIADKPTASNRDPGQCLQGHTTGRAFVRSRGSRDEKLTDTYP